MGDGTVPTSMTARMITPARTGPTARCRGEKKDEEVGGG